MPDTPIDNAADEPTTATGARTAGAEDLRARAGAAAEDLRSQATDAAMAFAAQGKARASGTLDEISRLIGDNASQIDGAVGAQYGDYVRRAADAVSAFSGTLRDKDVDELIDDTRELVRQSPALALGMAAAAGFFLARVIKSGSEAFDDAATRTRTATTPRAAAAPKADDTSGRTDA